MLGAIAGDIIGSVYEFRNIKTTEFELFSPRCTFTDDTVLTVALADSILSKEPYTQKLKEYFRLYPYSGYGGNFQDWQRSSSLSPYHSFGNGSAMRVSPVAFAYDTLERVLRAAEESAAVTHNHPEGIKAPSGSPRPSSWPGRAAARATSSATWKAPSAMTSLKGLDEIRPVLHF